ncbi:unnamed protein product [Amoebophrya sp. A120]|nr:unnamed protein product [Amoebophrya sp. A120]|eukprot:GSA120T00002900001.1
MLSTQFRRRPVGGCLLTEGHTPLAVFFQVRTRKGKRKKRERMADRPAELKEMQREDKQGPVRLEDRVARGPEGPYSIARNINQYLDRLCGEEGQEFHYRRSKDFCIRHKHRMLRFAGMTHDFADVSHLEKPTLTNLEALQQQATLPQSAEESRFPFPHLLSYKVYWSHDASPDPTPNAYDADSVSSVRVTFDANDLPKLTPTEKERAADIAGPHCVSVQEQQWLVRVGVQDDSTQRRESTAMTDAGAGDPEVEAVLDVAGNRDFREPGVADEAAGQDRGEDSRKAVEHASESSDPPGAGDGGELVEDSFRNIAGEEPPAEHLDSHLNISGEPKIEEKHSTASSSGRTIHVTEEDQEEMKLAGDNAAPSIGSGGSASTHDVSEEETQTSELMRRSSRRKTITSRRTTTRHLMTHVRTERRTCISLEVDCFDRRNQNAALLGDQVEALLKLRTPPEAVRSIIQ